MVSATWQQTNLPRRLLSQHSRSHFIAAGSQTILLDKTKPIPLEWQSCGMRQCVEEAKSPEKWFLDSGIAMVLLCSTGNTPNSLLGLPGVLWVFSNRGFAFSNRFPEAQDLFCSQITIVGFDVLVVHGLLGKS
jgi:hypothetical protein